MRNTYKWLPTLAWGILFIGWLILLFTLSSQTYEQQSIQPLLRSYFKYSDLVRWLPDITITYNKSVVNSHTNPFQFIEFLFRKGSHLFVYATFAAIGFMLLRSFNPKRWYFALALTLVIAVVVPALDEWNQSGSSHRTGNATDVVLDFAGGCVGLIICFCLLGIVKLFRRRRS
ncbi:VanZ family protein [Paenibacillus castaneae]|uniref:VanZ family protein n=1 Tax=Paenibacillus castaneae TaxID=474957 RepID=UPI000C9A9D45|nr:VanZ family protein [Paenibacillus castaneae]NIK78165.1 VanZ family protein [Paenibacillus castaneae]